MKPTTSGTVFGLSRRTALLLVGIIVVFAIAAIAFTFTYGLRFSKPGGDGKAYERTAVQLLQKGFYGYKSKVPNAYMSPGYPLFLAAIYKATGHVWATRPRTALCLIQILIACTTILALFLIGRRLFNERIGLIAALLFALYPPMIVATNLWLTESLATCALVWFVFVAVLASQRQGWRLWALTGALLGVAVLVRPAVLPLGVAPFIALLITGPRKDLWKGIVVCGAAWALVMAPWVVRNEITLHEPAVLSSHSGDPFLAGVDPYYYELGPQYQFHGPTYEHYMTTQPAGVTKDDAANAAIREGFSKHTLRYLWWFTIGKAVHAYSTGWLATTDVDGTRSLLVRGFIVVLGWLGVAYAVRERRLLTLALMVVIGTLVLLPFAPEPRFVFSFLPLLSILAAFVLHRLWTAPTVALAASPAAPAEEGAE